MSSEPSSDALAIAPLTRYSEAWIRLGIVTPDEIAAQERAIGTTEDQSSEHYRWASFVRFFARQSRLSEDLARELFALGAADPDVAMGGSVMASVLRHPDCPYALLLEARQSSRRHLRRIAEQRLAVVGHR